MSTSDHISHPGRRRTDHIHHLVCIGHRGNGCSGRLITFGCHCGNGRCPDGSHPHSAHNPVIMVARYPDFGRIAARPDVNMYSEARSTNRSRRFAVKHVVFTLFDSVRSGLVDQTMWSGRALEREMARARKNCALAGLSEAIVLLRKGALQGAHRESRTLLRPIEGEDACDDLLDCLVSEIGKCESRP